MKESFVGDDEMVPCQRVLGTCGVWFDRPLWRIWKKNVATLMGGPSRIGLRSSDPCIRYYSLIVYLYSPDQASTPSRTYWHRMFSFEEPQFQPAKCLKVTSVGTEIVKRTFRGPLSFRKDTENCPFSGCTNV